MGLTGRSLIPAVMVVNVESWSPPAAPPGPRLPPWWGRTCPEHPSAPRPSPPCLDTALLSGTDAERCTTKEPPVYSAWSFRPHRSVNNTLAANAANRAHLPFGLANDRRVAGDGFGHDDILSAQVPKVLEEDSERFLAVAGVLHGLIHSAAVERRNGAQFFFAG